jgi:hypothetical protein
MLFKKRSKAVSYPDSKFKINDYVDFFHKDDLYFGHISNIYLDSKQEVLYDIDIAGQCPATLEGISEAKIVRIHK